MENIVLMQVYGVHNLTDYVHIVLTLKYLTPVLKVSVSDISNDTLLLKIKIAGSLENLVNVLKSVSCLSVEIVHPPAEFNTTANLFYRWKKTSERKTSINDAQPIATAY